MVLSSKTRATAAPMARLAAEMARFRRTFGALLAHLRLAQAQSDIHAYGRHVANGAGPLYLHALGHSSSPNLASLPGMLAERAAGDAGGAKRLLDAGLTREREAY